jgi:hypothetical protein
MPSQYGFQILAPYRSPFAGQFKEVEDGVLHNRLLRAVQQLRGQIYLQDGAIRADDLDGEGRFRMRGDEEAWHLILSDSNHQVIGSARYLVYPNTVSFESLRISHSALARDPEWAAMFKAAVEADLRLAQERNHPYVEVGGWALAPEWRGTRAALEIAVGSFALGQLWGGAIGACSATFRHGSASILGRLGGRPLQAAGISLPCYYDPQYGCMMEVLRFDYLSPDARFEPLLRVLVEKLSASPTISSSDPAATFTRSLLALAAATQVYRQLPALTIDSLADAEATSPAGVLRPVPARRNLSGSST